MACRMTPRLTTRLCSTRCPPHLHLTVAKCLDGRAQRSHRRVWIGRDRTPPCRRRQENPMLRPITASLLAGALSAGLLALATPAQARPDDRAGDASTTRTD